MVKRVLNFFNKEFHGVDEAALLLGGFAFLSQILGLLRDRLLVHLVGAGPVLDVYYAAFRIPDFLYVSVASLASVTVLMPFIVNKINNHSTSENTENNEKNKNSDKLEAQKFLNNIFSSFMIFMVFVCLLIYFLMPYLAHYIAPGFSEKQIYDLVKISRLMLLSPIFIGLSNLIGTITQLFKNFFVFSLSPVFYNIGIIFGIFFLYPQWGVRGLALGVVLGAILHFAIQIPTVVYRGFFPKFVAKINWREIFQVIKISLPRTLTLSVGSLAFMVLVAIASELKTGSISLFTFSYNLQSVPVGIIGISYSVAAFPILVKSFSLNDLSNFTKQIISTIKQIIFWSLPVIVLMIVLRAQIVRVVLGAKAFTWADTRLTSAAVALFVISLVSQSLVLLLVRGYYAAGQTKKPLFINIFSSIMIIVLAFVITNLFKIFPSLLNILEILLRVNEVPGTLMLSLPIAFTLGSILNFILIWNLFRKDFLVGVSSGIGKTFYQIIIGALVMGVVTYFTLNLFDDLLVLNTFIGIFLQGLISGIIGIIFGIFSLSLFKNKELADLSRALHRKFWKRRILSPEQPGL